MPSSNIKHAQRATCLINISLYFAATDAYLTQFCHYDFGSPCSRCLFVPGAAKIRSTFQWWRFENETRSLVQWAAACMSKFLMRACVLKVMTASKKCDYFTCFNPAKEEKCMIMHSLCLFCSNNMIEARGSNLKEKKAVCRKVSNRVKRFGGVSNMLQCSSNCSMQAFA